MHPETICHQGSVSKAICSESPFVLDHGGVCRSDGSYILTFYGKLNISTQVDITKALNEAYKRGYEKDRWI